MTTMAERPTLCPFDIKSQYTNSSPSGEPSQLEYNIISPPEAFSQFQENTCPLDDPIFLRQHQRQNLPPREDPSGGNGDDLAPTNQRGSENSSGISSISSNQYQQNNELINHQSANHHHHHHHVNEQSSSSLSSSHLDNDSSHHHPLDSSFNQVPSRSSSISEVPEYPPDDPTATLLLPCSTCGRTFSPSAIQRHQKVCEKLQVKRKSVTKLGPDSRENTPSPSNKKKEEEKKAKKSKWREKHQEFLRVIRAAKTTSSDNDPENSGPIIPSDYIKCPHCERHFGPKAADRHIEWCKEQSSRMNRTTAVDTAAVERLKSRTKYVPPKPGQNGWRAPKKRDVISSIPPPSSGPTPGSRLGSPPAPSLARHLSPPPMSPSRRGSTASTGSVGTPQLLRSGSMSLGRSAGRQFSAYLQSITGNTQGYGTSSGYGQSPLVRRDSSSSQFSRSGSLRVPSSPKAPPRRMSGRMARRRDLASDMMASVCLDSKSKRGEPEGDEGKSNQQRHMYGKEEEVPYDPFSAAELQFQALLENGNGGSLGAAGLGSGMLGSTGSLKYVGLGMDSSDSLLMKNRSKNRSNNLSTLSLTSIGMESSDFISKSPSLKRSSKFSKSPERYLGQYRDEEDNKKDKVGSPVWSWSRSPQVERKHSAFRSPITVDPPLESTLDSPSFIRKPLWGSSAPQSPYVNRKSSWETSSFRSTSPNRKHSWESSPPRSPTPSSRKTSWGSPNRSPSPTSRKSSYGSPPPRPLSPTQKQWEDNPWLDKSSSPTKSERKLSPPTSSLSSFSPRRLFTRNMNNSTTSAWTDNLDSSKNFSRHLGSALGRQGVGDSSPGSAGIGGRNQNNNYPFENLRNMKKLLDSADDSSQKKTFDNLDDQQQRVSSGSSTDSSLPPLSSPPSSSSPLDRKVSGGEDDSANNSSLRLPRFCHECGHKYPVLMAKFCCQCGSKRPSLDK